MTSSGKSLADIVVDPDDIKRDKIPLIPVENLPDIDPSMIINDWLYLGNAQVCKIHATLSFHSNCVYYTESNKFEQFEEIGNHSYFECNR